MNINEIIKKIEHVEGSFPKQEFELIISNSEIFIPEFLKILEYTKKHYKKILKNDTYFAHIVAMYFLAQFRVEESYPIIIEIISKHPEIVDGLLGDVITEDLNRIIGSVASDDINPIIRIIENKKIDEYVRSAAIRSLLVLYTQDKISRETIIAIFKQLFYKLERKPLYIWSELIYCSCDLHANELINEIKKVYEDDLIDFLTDDFSYVEKCFQKERYKIINELKKKREYSPIADLISELKDWACFNDNKAKKKPKKKNDNFKVYEPIEKKKIGRNDPCPCNSGLKYKKCCGKNF